MSGKGSAPRPFDVPREVFESNHARIFGERKKKDAPPEAAPAKEDASIERPFSPSNNNLIDDILTIIQRCHEYSGDKREPRFGEREFIEETEREFKKWVGRE